MKKQPFFLLLLLAPLCLAAQTQQPTQTTQSAAHAPQKFSRWSLDILAGPAFPVGQYGSMESGIPGGGPVHTGGSLEISGTLHLDHSFGIVLLAGGQLNKGNGIPYIEPYTPTVKTYNSKYWRIARFMTGAEYALPLNKKQGLSLLARLLGGIQKTKPADYNFYFPNSDNRLSYPSVNLPASFTYQIDAGLKWQARSRIALMAYAGYNGSRTSRDFTYILESFAPPSQTVTRKGTFPTGSLLFRAGIEIGL